MTGLSISVIIPVFNGERFLAEAIESVLAQDYHPLEVIVVDDGSTDGTARIAKDFGERIQYVQQENRGPAAARNMGLRHAQGDVIGFLDADDLWTPGKLDSQSGVLLRSSSVDIVAGHFRCIKPAHDGQFVPHECPKQGLSLGASLVRRCVFGVVGTFDESLRLGEDWDWYIRACERGISILVQDDVVLLYRRHEGNLTNQREADDRAMVQILKRRIERRRRRNSTLPFLPPVSEREVGGPSAPGECQ